jgi:hypothetical protein
MPSQKDLPIQKVDSIMAQLGFNPDSTDGAKAAFIKNLIKQAYGVEVALPVKYQEKSIETFEDFTIAAVDKKLLDEKPKQLEFDIQNPPKVG